MLLMKKFGVDVVRADEIVMKSVKLKRSSWMDFFLCDG
jgi:hypothetical protein